MFARFTSLYVVATIAIVAGAIPNWQPPPTTYPPTTSPTKTATTVTSTTTASTTITASTTKTTTITVTVPTTQPITTTVVVTPPPATTTATSGPSNQCNTGSIQCCQSVQSGSSGAASLLLGLLGVILADMTALVGITCSPLSIIGAAGTSCSAQTVCCENNSFNGIIAIGCTPININL